MALGPIPMAIWFIYIYSSLEALRNALYKFKTYLLTYFTIRVAKHAPHARHRHWRTNAKVIPIVERTT